MLKQILFIFFTKAPEDITLYDLDQLFGGAYAATQDENGDLDYSEINLDY